MPCNLEIGECVRSPSWNDRLQIRRGDARWKVNVINTGDQSAEVNVVITFHQAVVGGGLALDYELAANIPWLLAEEQEVGQVDIAENLTSFTLGQIGVTVLCTPVGVDGTPAQKSYNVRLVG